MIQRETLSLERLESKHLLSAVSFVQQSSATSEQTALVPDLGIPAEAAFLVPADIDSDSDSDLVYASTRESNILWYPNDGAGGFGQPRTVIAPEDATGFGVYALNVADLDGDDKPDLLVRLFDSEDGRYKLTWMKNLGGEFSEHISFYEGTGATPQGLDDILVVDVDSDHDTDILFWVPNSEITFFKNNGMGEFSPQESDLFFRLFLVADLNGDNNIDHFYSSTGDNALIAIADGQLIRFSDSDELRRYENVVGAQMGDINGDGQMDILIASQKEDEDRGSYAWIMNSGDGTFRLGSLIDTVEFNLELGFRSKTRNMKLADLDGDSDLDILVGDNRRPPGEFEVAWYENEDGSGSFGSRRVVAIHEKDALNPFDAFYGVTAISDFDSDGRLDIAAAMTSIVRVGNGEFGPLLEARSEMVWYENRVVGDSNKDGTFDSGDLVRVFQAGQYEDGILGNSTFDDGDWNGDGEFDSGDLVFAFQSGTFASAATPSELAAAVDVLFLENWNRNERFDVAFLP